MAKKIHWGIIGLGNIAHHFVKDLALIPEAVLTAVASRNVIKAKDFASEYNHPKAYGSYEELLADPQVDVVYIATPHTSHANLAIKSMKAGKHVLCEKPLGVNSTEVQEMVAVAQEEKVFLMEALWSRFNPSIQAVLQQVKNNSIGAIRYVKADFGFYALDRDKNGRILNPELAGGSILDIGIYPIFLSYMVLGMPKSITANALFGATGAELQTSVLFNYDSAQAVLLSSFMAKTEMRAEIGGEKGQLYIEPRWHEAQAYSIEKDGEKTTFPLPTMGRGYSYEINEVHQCLTENKLQSALWSHKNSLDLITLLDAVRAKAGVVFPFEKE